MKSRLLCPKNTATILSFIGCIGVVVTAVAAVKATPKAAELLKQTERKKGASLTKFEMVKTVGIMYAPAVVLGTATIACIFASNVLNKHCQQSLASAYALLDQSFREYRKKLIELHGEEADIEVREAIVREHCDYHQTNIDVPDKKLTFYDPISERIIIRYEREIMDAEYHFNRNFVLRGYASLNEFYEFLGIEKTELGDKLGWSVECGYYWIDFEHMPIEAAAGAKETWYSIEPVFYPDEDYNWEEL